MSRYFVIFSPFRARSTIPSLPRDGCLSSQHRTSKIERRSVWQTDTSPANLFRYLLVAICLYILYYAAYKHRSHTSYYNVIIYIYYTPLRSVNGIRRAFISNAYTLRVYNSFVMNIFAGPLSSCHPACCVYKYIHIFIGNNVGCWRVHGRGGENEKKNTKKKKVSRAGYRYPLTTNPRNAYTQ